MVLKMQLNKKESSKLIDLNKSFKWNNAKILIGDVFISSWGNTNNLIDINKKRSMGNGRVCGKEGTHHSPHFLLGQHQ